MKKKPIFGRTVASTHLDRHGAEARGETRAALGQLHGRTYRLPTTRPPANPPRGRAGHRQPMATLQVDIEALLLQEQEHDADGDVRPAPPMQAAAGMGGQHDRPNQDPDAYKHLQARLPAKRERQQDPDDTLDEKRWPGIALLRSCAGGHGGPTPEQCAAALCEALVKLASQRSARHAALLLAIVSIYLRTHRDHGALATMADVKKHLLLYSKPDEPGAEPASENVQNLRLLTPLVMLHAGRRRTAAQRDRAVGRLDMACRLPDLSAQSK